MKAPFMQGLRKPYTFQLTIKEGGETLANIAVSAGNNADEVAKAKRTIQRALNDFTPSLKNPETVCTVVSAPTTPAVQEPASKNANLNKPEGVYGLVKLHCPKCHSTFGSFLKERRTEFTCKCGHHIDLTANIAPYRFVCPHCEKETWGTTNLENPSIVVTCKCGRDVELLLEKDAKEYRNCLLGGKQNER